MTLDMHDCLVLVVDDNDAARYAKSRIVTRAGLRVIEAAKRCRRRRNSIPT